MIFNNLEEIEKYYNKETNTYIFKEDDNWIKLVEFNFDLKIYSDIKAWNIGARNISAWSIKASNIDALDIHALNINAKNIDALDIRANNIEANDIIASDIKAKNIHANNINFDAVCISYENIICKSISGSRENAKYLTLDGEVIIKEE